MSTTFEALMDEKMGHTAYWAGEEAAWLSEDALGVVALASEMQIAVCGVEVWLATDQAPRSLSRSFISTPPHTGPPVKRGGSMSPQ